MNKEIVKVLLGKCVRASLTKTFAITPLTTQYKKFFLLKIKTRQGTFYGLSETGFSENGGRFCYLRKRTF